MQLKERKQKATESLTELGQDIWRLTNLAYPTAPADLRATLAKEQFIDALVSSDMRLRIKQARPTDMRATNQQETKESGTHDELKTLKDNMFKMQRTLESLTCRNDANDRSDKNQPQAAFKKFGQQVVPHKNNRMLSANVGPVALKRTLDTTAHRQKRKLHQKTRINR